MANIELLALEARLKTVEPVHALVADIVADDSPWLFRDDHDAYVALKDHLRSRLELDDVNSIVVGSAKCGYSLAPDTFGRPFTDRSDVDVALISPKLFDELWASLLNWRYPWHTGKWSPDETKWALRHMEEHFAGFVDPLQIKVPILGAKRVPTQVRDRVNQWFDALKLAENIGPARGHSIEGRLYRSLDHLSLYMSWGLQQVRQQRRGEKS